MRALALLVVASFVANAVSSFAPSSLGWTNARCRGSWSSLRSGTVLCRAPSDAELSQFGITREDLKRYGNRSPAEVANMKKWGRILSQADTFDDEYLEKAGAAGQNAATPDSATRGTALVVAGSTVVFAALAFASQH